MSILKKIKETIGNQTMKSEVANRTRNRKVITMENALTVGILFDASENEDHDLVKKYVTFLKELKKKPKAIGYFSDRAVPQSTYSKLEFDYFSFKDLNWQQKLSGVVIENFVNEEFDILVDLNIYDRFPLYYLASLSKAKFKVGKKGGKGDDIYDMTIEMGKETGLKFLLRNVDTYLTMLNKKKEE